MITSFKTTGYLDITPAKLALDSVTIEDNKARFKRPLLLIRFDINIHISITKKVLVPHLWLLTPLDIAICFYSSLRRFAIVNAPAPTKPNAATPTRK